MAEIPNVTLGSEPHTDIITSAKRPNMWSLDRKPVKPGKKKKGRDNMMDIGPDDEAGAAFGGPAEEAAGNAGRAALASGQQTLGMSPIEQYYQAQATGRQDVGGNVSPSGEPIGEYGFRAKESDPYEPPSYDYGYETPATETAARKQAEANPLMDTGPDDNPYHAPSFSAGSTNRGSYAGVQNAGILGYDGSDQARMGVANQLGYQRGQGDLSGLAGVVGMAAGIPGVGLIADAIPKSPTEPVTVTREDGSTYTDARDRSYGAVGTTDARGNVFSEDGVAYDPVTGQRVPGVFKDRATATPHIRASLGFAPEGYEAPPATAAEAGLMSIAGNDSISQVLDEATIASTPEIGRASVQREINADRKAAGQSYTHTDNDGDTHHVPAGRSAVTDRHGNAVTDNSGNVVTSTNTGGGNDDNDSGGGGGGK